MFFGSHQIQQTIIHAGTPINQASKQWASANWRREALVNVMGTFKSPYLLTVNGGEKKCNS